MQDTINRYTKNLPEYVSNLKPLTDDEVELLKKDKSVVLHSPIPDGAERDMVRPDSGDAWEIPWIDFMETQHMRMRNMYPVEYMAKYNPREGASGEIPEPFYGLLMNMTMDEMARSVEMDNPMYYGSILMAYVMNHKDTELKEEKITEAGFPFLNLVPDVNETITDYQKKYLRITFRDKWANWAIRPEEHLRNMGYDPELSCLYEAPNHPENGVGHVAASMGIYTGLLESFHMTQEVKDTIFDACYAVGGLRTVAGVHTWLSATDTIDLLGIKY